MRINLSKGAFYQAEALTDLLTLMRSFIDGLHDWVADSETITVASGYLREHAPRLAETYLELARKGTVAATWTGAMSATVVKIEDTDLADHVSDLCKRPAVVVVEDLNSDGAFIRAICTIFRARRLQEALSKNWIEITHGGGSGVSRVAEHVAQRYRHRVRVVALMDSDRMFPGQQTQKHLEASRLASNGIVAHVLELREAENYVPNRVLRGVGKASDASHKLAWLARLTAEQRGYFDMKHGFGRPDRPPRIHSDQRTLFSGVERDVLLGLRGGFGGNLLELMEASSGSLTEQDFVAMGEPTKSDLVSLITVLTDII